MTGARFSGASLDARQRKAVAWSLVPIVILWQANGVYLPPLARIYTGLFWLADILQWIVVPAIAVFVLARNYAVLPRQFGFDPSRVRTPATVLETAGVALTMALAYFVTRNFVWSWLGEPTGFFHLVDVFPAGWLRHVTWLYSAFTAGFVESVFFIGLPWLLYRSIRADPSRVFFVFVAGSIFAVAHWEQGPHVVVGAFLSNAVACAWYFGRGSLWGVAAGHTIVDLIAF